MKVKLCRTAATCLSFSAYERILPSHAYDIPITTLALPKELLCTPLVPATPETASPIYPLPPMPTLYPVWNSFVGDWMQESPSDMLHPTSMPQTAVRSWPGTTCTSGSSPAQAGGRNAKMRYGDTAPGVSLGVDTHLCFIGDGKNRLFAGDNLKWVVFKTDCHCQGGYNLLGLILCG